MVRSSVCAYPWDLLGDDSAADRFAALGADRVMLAAAYHAVRAGTPRHATRRMVEAPRSALYIPVRESAWSGRRLRPVSAADWMGADTDSFGHARAALERTGLATDAWVVLTHDDAPTSAATADLRVRNAFGDTLAHALCPASAEVREYCVTLVEEVVSVGAEHIMLEAMGPLGIEHAGAHDKTSLADWTPIDSALLSICFCAACTSDLAAAGVDAHAAAATVRAAVGSPALTVEEAIGEYAAPILRTRRAAASLLLGGVVGAARSAGASRVSAHAGLDEWSTSSFAFLGDGVAAVDAVVLSENTIDSLDAAAIAALRAQGSGAIAAYLSAPPDSTPEHLRVRWREYIDRGVDELVIYHGGLLSAQRAASVTTALAAITAATEERT